MSKLNDKGFLSGHTGNMVFREVNGRQIVQSMPSHYRDAKIFAYGTKVEAQLKQRSGMRNILAHYRILKDVIRCQFEDAVGPHRPYDCFKHHNLLLPAIELSKKDYDIGLAVPAPYIVSHGTLPPLNISIVDNTLHFQMDAGDWRRGDILRLIRIKSNGETDKPSYLTFSYSDTIINKVEDKLIVSEPLTSGAYTYVHLRRTSKGWQSSTQRLILL